MGTVIVLISFLFMALAAVLAIRLIRVTGRRFAWTTIAMSIAFMVVRRGYTMYRLLAGDILRPEEYPDELMGMTIAIMLMAGIAWIAPLFRSITASREALAASEKRIATIAQAAPVGIVVHGADGRVVLSNQLAQQLLGVSQEDMPGKGLSDSAWRFLREDGTPMPQEEYPVSKVLATGKPLLDDVVGLLRPGSLEPAWVLDNVMPTFDSAGNIVEVVTSFMDITSRKQAEQELRESQEKYRQLIETTDTGYVIVDGQGRVTDANLEYARLTGRQRLEEVLGHTVLEWTAPHDREQNAAAVKLCVEQGFVRTLEIDYVSPGGEFTPVEINATVFGPGEPVRILALCRDITDRKRAQEALRASEAKYRRLHESMMDAFVNVDMQGRIVEFNNAYQQMLGYSGEELFHLTYVDLTPEKWHAFEAKIVVEQILVRGYSGVYEKEYRRKDGTVFPVELRTFLIRDTAGQPAGMWALVRDITDRKQAEEALRKAHDELEVKVRERTAELTRAVEQLHVLFNILPVGISIVNQDRKILNTNPALREILDLPPDLTAGSIAFRRLFLRGDGTSMPLGEIPSVLALKEQREVRNVEVGVVKEDRTITWLTVSAAPLPGVGAAVVVVDITDRKRAEEALKQSEMRFRHIVEHGPHMYFYVQESEGRYTYISPGVEEILGRPPEFYYRPHGDTSAPGSPINDAAKVWVARMWREGITPPPLLYEVLHADGHHVILENYESPVIRDGKVVEVLGVAHDITERRRAQEELVHLASFPQLSPDPIVELAMDGRILYANPAAQTLLPDLQTLGSSHPWLRGAEDLRRVWVDGQARTSDDELAIDDRVFHQIVRFIPEIQCIRIYGHDITNRKRAEEQLQASNAALAQRAIQIRKLAAQLTVAEQRERRRLADLLHDHLQQYLVAAKIKLATMARSPQDQLAREMRETSGILDLAIKESRSLMTDLCPPILHQGGLRQALEWLGRWAEQNHGLTLVITADAELPPIDEDARVAMFLAVRELVFNIVKHAKVNSAEIELARRGERIVLTVRDGGVGLDMAQLGLDAPSSNHFGLLRTRERLELLGGTMEIDSAPGRGCRFTLTMPCGRAESSSAPHATLQAAPAGQETAPPGGPDRRRTGRKIRVFLADDHAVFRQGMAELLQREADIEVVGEAGDGEATLRMARQLRPDVVLMDATMPVMDGMAATRTLHQELPEIRVIVLSMYEEADQAHQMIGAGAVTYLTKTAGADAVVAAVRACCQ